MTDKEIKLECVRLAIHAKECCTTPEDSTIKSIAKDLYAFVPEEVSE